MNNTDDIKVQVQKLLEDKEYARSLGQAGRETAIKLFGKELIKSQWMSFMATV